MVTNIVVMKTHCNYSYSRPATVSSTTGALKVRQPVCWVHRPVVYSCLIAWLNGSCCNVPVLGAIKQALRVSVTAVVHEAVKRVDVTMRVIDRNPVYRRVCFYPLACARLQARCCSCGISRRGSSLHNSFKHCGSLSEGRQAVYPQLPFYSLDAKPWSALQRRQLV
jgi:hypothetical protein